MPGTQPEGEEGEEWSVWREELTIHVSYLNKVPYLLLNTQFV